MKRRPSNPFALSQQYIIEAEARVAEQRNRIARLKSSGRSCNEAAAALKREELVLLKLRNHAELTRSLMDTNPEFVGNDSSGQEITRSQVPTETPDRP
jgi:hypothetical protein